MFIEGRVHLHTKLEGGENNGEVRDVQWDVLSEDYLLVAHSGGSLRLISAQGPTILATFRHPAACRARCIAWLPDCPGMFVTGGKFNLTNFYGQRGRIFQKVIRGFQSASINKQF